MPCRFAFGLARAAFPGFCLALVLHGASDLPAPAALPENAFAASAGPVVMEGALANGVRYFVLPHASPRNDLGIRLIVQAGSLDERDDERGFAHFVEHMAFRGTHSHPAGGIRQSFERLGLAFGADLNARTHSTHTVYLMDLPDGRAGGLGEALGLLREFADGISFLPDQVARESGVVLSELRARDTPSQRLDQQVQAALYAGTAIANRDVIGVPALIQRATADQLRAFYRRNYTPGRIAVVVVGPVDPAMAIEMVTQAFASMTAAAEAVPPAAVPLPSAPAGFAPHLIIAPDAPGVGVEVVSIRRRPLDDQAGRRQEVVERIAGQALASRLRASQEAAFPPLGSTRAEQGPGACTTLRHDSIETSAVVTRWPDAIAFLEMELRRIRLQGFSQLEIEEAIAVELATARAAVSQFASAPAARVADEIEHDVQMERHWRSPAEKLAEFKTVAANVTPRIASASVADAFPETSLHLVVRSPVPIEGGPQALVIAATNSIARPLVPERADTGELTFAYSNFGRPGAVVAHTRDDDLKIEQIAFANGVRLNLRPSTLEPEQFRLRVSFSQNAGDVPRNRPGLAELAGMVYLGAHLGRHLDTEISRLLGLHGVTRQFDITHGVLNLTFTGQASELPFTLGLVTAFTSDLLLDPVVYRVACSRYNHYYMARQNNLPQQALAEALYGGGRNDPRLQLPSPARVANYKFADVKRWIETYWVNGPLEIGIVGDFSTDQTIAAAAATVGTLVPRVIPPANSPLGTSRRGSQRDLTLRTVAGSASVCVAWPLAVAHEPRGNAAASFAVNVLADRLRATLRDELGATYTPAAGIRRDPRQPDFAFAWMITTFVPAQADEFTDRSVSIARRLAKNGITEEEFERLREPARARTLADLRNNGWWLDRVVGLAQSHPEVLAEARLHATAVESLTVADVNAAARVFATAATIVIVRPASP